MLSTECSFARLSNGLRLAYVEQGPRTGPAIVLLHGYTDSHRSFDLLRPYFPASLRVIAVTARGHGQSDKPEAGYEIADMAADVRALLDVLNVERAVVVGHSMGSAVALSFAAAYPERTAGLVLVGAFAGFQNNPAVAELAQAVASFGDSVDPEFVRGFQESTFAAPVAPDFINTVIGESLLCPTFVWRAAADGLLRAAISDAALLTQAPALLIYGEQDAFVPMSDQMQLRDLLQNARLSVMREVGHTPHWERPAETATLILSFVAEQPLQSYSLGTV